MIEPDHWLRQVLDDVGKGRNGMSPQTSMYGAADIAAQYCGFQSPPSPVPGHWQHGWKCVHRRLNAQYEMGELEPLSPDDCFWVARKDQEACLHAAGLTRAKAISLPCVYLPRSQHPRRPNTLLVMPAHSLDYTRHDWKFDEYADQIASIRKDFDDVVACVHQSCFQRGLWVDSFRDRGIPVIEGAHTADPLSLQRLEALFSSFEYVTSNSHGSHLAYGAFWGARVSLYGSYADMRVEDYSNTPFYQRYPELIQPAVDAINEASMRAHYPELFADHPRQAIQREEWGANELGAENRQSPDELRKLFQWAWSDILARKLSATSKKVVQAIVPRSLRHRFLEKSAANSREQKDFERELNRIRNSPAGAVASTSILGHELRFDDGPACASGLRRLFQQNTFRFHTARPRPRILDIGAGIGLASIYFAQQHPSAEIIAVEPDPERFELLTANCRSFGLDNVKPQTWPIDDFPSENLAAEPELLPKLNELLDRPVDLLKLDVGGAETGLLERCREQMHRVDRILVDYADDFHREQRLSSLLGFLGSSGFRVHLHSPFPAPQPFVHRPVTDGCDLRLVVFAIREA